MLINTLKFGSQLVSKSILYDGIKLLPLVILNAFLEMFSVAMAIPLLNYFFGTSSSSGQILDNVLLFFTDIFGFIGVNSELLLFAIFYIFAAIFRLFVMYKVVNFSKNIQVKISNRIISTSFNRPLDRYNRNRDIELVKDAVNETKMYVKYYIISILNGFISISIISFMIFFLIAVDIKTTLLMFFLIIFIYLIIFISNKLFLKKLAIAREQGVSKQYSSAFNVVTMHNVAKIYNKEDFFLNKFYYENGKLGSIEVMFSLISSFPKIIIETALIVGLIMFAYFYADDNLNFIYIISIFALAGFKLLPQINQIYLCITHLKMSDVIIEKLIGKYKTILRSKL